MRYLFVYVTSLILFGYFVGCGLLPEAPKPDRPRSTKPRDILDSPCEKIVVDSTQTKKFEQDQIIDRFLERHNRYRSWYGLPKLKWDNNMAAYAQDWANYLKNNKACKMHHRSALNQKIEKWGENLAWFKMWGNNIDTSSFFSSPEKAVHGWTAECKDYTYETGACTPGEKCGHFTQVVWRDSQKIGCGVAVCISKDNTKDVREELWVCNYDPPGNLVISTPQGKIPKKPY